MSRAMITESNLTAIANAIRAKLGVETTYTPAQMATAIGTIHGEPVNQEKTVTQNGEVTPDSGYDGLSKVTVNVPGATLVSKSITENGSYNPASDNADGYSDVTVNVPNSYAAADEGKVVSGGALVAQTARSSEITENGTYNTTTNNSVTVNVSGGGGGGGGGYPDAVVVMDFTKYTGVFRGVTYSAAGAVFPASGSANIDIPYFSGGMTLYLDVTSMQLASGDHRRFIMADSAKGLIYRSTGKWAFYNGNWEDSAITDGDFFDGAKVKVYVDANNKWHIYKDNILVFEPTGAQVINVPTGSTTNYAGPFIGSYGGQVVINAVFAGLRVYHGDYTE